MAKVELMVPVVAAEGKAAELKEVLQTLIEPTRAEPGNHFYRLYESKTPGKLFFHELWENQEALDSHMKSPHFLAAVKKAEGLLAEPLEINQVTEVV